MESEVAIDVRSLKASQIQLELKRRGLSSSGKKSELRRRLEEALRKEKASSPVVQDETVSQSVAASGDVSKDECSGVSVEQSTESSELSDAPTSKKNDAVEETKNHVNVPLSSEPPVGETKSVVSPGEEQSQGVEVRQTLVQVGGSRDELPHTEGTGKELLQPTEGMLQPPLTGEGTGELVQTGTQVGDMTKVEVLGSHSTEDMTREHKDEQSQVTEPVSGGAVLADSAMELDDLVVHPIDEDDFKLETSGQQKQNNSVMGSHDGLGDDGDGPLIKKRRINVPLGMPSATPTGATGGGDRKRKWRSSTSRSQSTTSISSDVIEKIVPVSVAMDTESEKVGVLQESGNPEEGEVPANSEEEETSVEQDVSLLQAEKERLLKLAEEETRRRIEVRLREKKGPSQPSNKITPVEAPHSTVDPEPSPVATSKEVIVDYNQPIRMRPVATPQKPPSCILHVANLVRPFAQSQLRELLCEDGDILPDGFWINKIKSHCFAVYANVEVAQSTRERLDGVRWPSTSPRVLEADFSTEAEVTQETGGLLAVSAGASGDTTGTVDQLVKQIPTNKMADTSKAPTEPTSVEDTTTQEAAEPAPVNRLDELFKKTLTCPQVYWLPLSAEEGERRLTEMKAEEALRVQKREERQKEREEKQRQEQEEREKRRKQREEERKSHSRHRSGSRDRHRR